jgi:arylsulfatase A-like enzyme
VAENTLLIFLGDNGSDAPLGKVHGYSSSAPLLGKKGTHHEGGVRVPFICAWAQPDPGNPCQKRLPVASGKINSQIGTITDLLPTICALAGVAIPDDYQTDGFDLKDQLNGRYNPNRSNTFLNHFPHEHRSAYYTSFIQDHWKLVYHYPIRKKPVCELYNLKEDPYEKHNLADNDPVRLKRMILAMQADMQSKDAFYPVKGGKALKPEMP